MTIISVDASDLKRSAPMFRKKSQKAQDAAATVSKQMANYLVQRVQLHASGRPGPNIITGEYFNDIQVFQSQNSSNSAITYVGTTQIQAARLEFGFVGTDSAGRHYMQPPFPHWRPGIQDMVANAPAFKKSFLEEMR